jgi:hypothetical protein
MAVTVKVNGTGNSLVHKGSDGVSTATLPDVCKTPSPGGPVPVPYPNVAFSSDLANGSTTVKADGGKMIAVKGSEFRRSTGDEPGTAGGVKSNTFAKEATWLTYSFDVKIDGRNACRLTDKMLHNHQNSANLAGEIQAYLAGLDDDELDKVCAECRDEAEAAILANNDMIEAYQRELVRGHATGPDVTLAVHRRVTASSAGAVVVGAATNPDGSVEFNEPPPGPCGPLVRTSDEAHEKVHQERAAKLMQQCGGGPGTPAYDAARVDPAAWVEDEVKAHTAGRQEWEAFIKECDG